jgi:hypothetical protein
LLDRKTMEEALAIHTGNHFNELILRGDLPAEVTLSTTDSYIHLVEVPGSES